MSDDLVARRVNLFRRFAVILVAVVGVIFLIVGLWLLSSRTWDRATGTVGQCERKLTPRSSGSSSRVDYLCDVTWESAGVSHRATVNLGPTNIAPGGAVELRVKGDDATVATPAWMGAASTSLGALLVVVSGVLTLRARRKG